MAIIQPLLAGTAKIIQFLLADFVAAKFYCPHALADLLGRRRF